MSECTPGPWVRQGRTVFVTEDRHNAAGTLYKVRRFQASVRGEGSATTEELEANARLIAAAPELREACEAIADAGFPFDWDDYPETSPRLRKLLKAAIAKARGEQP